MQARSVGSFPMCLVLKKSKIETVPFSIVALLISLRGLPSIFNPFSFMKPNSVGSEEILLFSKFIF